MSEHIVARVDELKDGQMKEVAVGEQAVLVVRVNGAYRVFGAYCPHQGAPMAKGVIHQGRLQCPWHQSVFDADSGAMVEPPTLDHLPRYDVRIVDGNVVATLPVKLSDSCELRLAARDPADSRTYVILGTGAAGTLAAQTLRQEGFTGHVVMITREECPPYDRTELSKRYLAKADARKPFLRDAGFWDRCGVELFTGRRVRQVDPAAKTIAFDQGEGLAFDKLLLASGSDPVGLAIPGAELDGIFLLRRYDDCERIRQAALTAKCCVVVGAGFIGMEVAATLAGRGVQVAVVAPQQAPFESTLGPEIGNMYRELHEQNGAKFFMGRTVARFEGDGKVQAVVLDDGQRIEADLVVVGIGVRPITNYLTNVHVNDDAGVTVSRNLQLTQDVYAAGDIAAFPDWRTGVPIRIEHWRLAQQLGRCAAQHMAGRDVQYRGVPFFWTNQFKVNTRYVGFAADWDEIVYDGDVGHRQFIAYFVKRGGVLAAAGCKEDQKMCIIGEILRDPAVPTVADIHRQLKNETLVTA